MITITKADFHADHDEQEKNLCGAERLTMHEAMIDAGRMPLFLAELDAQEMLNYRAMTPGEAFDSWKAEEARKEN